MLPGGQYTIYPTCRLKGQFLSFCHFQKKKFYFGVWTNLIRERMIVVKEPWNIA